MSTLTVIIIALAIMFFGARVKASMGKALDLLDDGLDVGAVHMKAMKNDAKLSAELNSIEKKAELSKRLNKFNLKDAKGNAITLDSLKVK